ncbi:MAG: elongation factor G [Vicinamibacteraceae bacterium]
MRVFDAPAIRNVALAGHSGAGKTQLASALLFTAGAVNRLGKVDEGTTVTDYDEEAIARKHTLGSSLAWLEWQHTKINLIDTPGVGNLLTDTRGALRVVEAVLVVVDAVSGVQVQTEAVWQAAAEVNLPRLIAVNRLDRDRASLERTLDSLREAFGRAVVPITLPVGTERGFQGVVNLLTMQAMTYLPDGSGAVKIWAIPASMAVESAAARETLVELVAEADDTLMARFFDEGTLTNEELASGLARAVADGKIFPVLCTSALTNVAMQPLLDALVRLVPSPADRPFSAIAKDGSPTSVLATDTGPTTVFVWRTVADPFAGRITLFRVVTGRLVSDTTATNVTRGDASERLGHLLVVQGKTHTSVSEVKAGDLGAVAKLKETQSGDTLAEKGAAIVFPPLAFPAPVLAYAIEPKTRGDEDKISSALHRLQEEDPTVHFDRDPQTKDQLLSGQGQLHIEVTVAKLKRRFGVDVTLKLPRVPYRETIGAPAEAHGRHKKQTGGHGQFGDCTIKVEPLPRGADFEFIDDTFGGSIPRQYVPAVEKGIQEARLRGYLAGYPMVDFRATVVDGSFHPVDSNELSFKMAGSLAFKDAMARARPTLLEPVMHVEVQAPSEYAGDLMGDLNGRRGRIAGMDTRGATTIIRAQVPMAEMLTYEQHLTSATGGRGAYSMSYSHYDEVPAHQQAKIVANAKAQRAGQEVEAE